MSRRRRPGREHEFTVIEGEGRRSSRVGQTAVLYLLLALITILIVQVGYHWLGGWILARRLKVVAAEPGYMDKVIELEGVISRGEQVLYAPYYGVILELAPPGERVAAGDLLLTLAVFTPAELEALEDSYAGLQSWWEILRSIITGWFNFSDEKKPKTRPVFTGEIPPWHTVRAEIRSETPGLLSYHLDGLEGLNGQILQTQAAGGELPEPTAVEVGAIVEAGQPVLKIVDNWRWSYHVSLPLDPGRALAAQETVTAAFDFAPGSPITARLQEAVIDAEYGEVRLTYLLEQQLPGFETVRRSGAVVSFQRLNGIIVPETALLDHLGKTGVFINNGGTVTFAPVETLRFKEGQALVAGIAPYSLVIGTPELVREGQRLH